jgi:6-phosphogluconate dehydrogenase
VKERCDDIGVVGLGVMGAHLARNLASRGYRVAGWDRDPDAARKLASDHPEAKLSVAEDLPALVGALGRPRRILVMVPAGDPVDAVIDALGPLLEADDVVVDGGNSLFRDTDRRVERTATLPWRFVGMGVSGGSEGALTGPSLMPGGDREAWERLRPLLESIAATSDTGPCVTYCGTGSAGHFVKMVHNGIEYGDMQLIAETAVMLRGRGLEPAAVADTFDDWNQGELESFLVEITAKIFRVPDPEQPGSLLLDAVLDRAGQKGTGRWTAMAAIELGVAIPSIAAAVDARVLSADVELRVRAEAAFEDSHRSALAGISPDDLRDALFASKIASYTQGFELLAAGSRARGYGTDRAEIARIWKAGCIIRARFLDDVRTTFEAEPDALLALSGGFRDALAARLPAWRRVVAAGAAAGVPIPGLAASLGWFDSLVVARGSANLIQAQRDYFGSHTYERVERPGTFVHTDWANAERFLRADRR